MSRRSTRRQFLGTTAALAAASWAGGRAYAAEASASPGPNETVNMALIGCGGQGRYDMANFMTLPGVRIVAVCDVDETRMGEARQQAGGEKVVMAKDFRKLLDNKDIHAVIVGTPGHWHALPTIEACRAGKDVYVEKPLATSIAEGRAAVEAAKKYDRIVQIGTQQHSWEHYERAVEIIRQGKLGDITEVKVWDMDYLSPGFGSPPDTDPPKQLDWDLWLGPSPKVPYNQNRFLHHYWFFDYGGGWQLDWAVHHYDIVHWAMGVKAPVAATAMGGKFGFKNDNTQWPDTFSGILEYGPGPVAKSGFVLQYTYRGCCRREHRSHAKCFYGSEASMLLDRSGYTIRWERQKDEQGQTKEESFVGGPHRHYQVFLDCVRGHKKPPCDVEVGHYASNPGHLMNIAWKTGRRIRWDAEKEQVLDDPQASALGAKPYREPWTLDVEPKPKPPEAKKPA